MSQVGTILVVNAGSSSIRVALYGHGPEPLLTAAASEIGRAGATVTLAGATTRHVLPDHRAALGALIEALTGAGYPPARLGAAAHRVVHGGADLRAAARITPAVRDAIAACVPLAPLHNPHALAAIDALGALAPDLPQFASFDTAFHAQMPEVARRYALPDAADARGIRRYGFHGLSCKGLVAQLPALSGAPLPARLLVLHLGNGASLTAIRDGRSFATTMGYSPLEGLTMGTRSGDIDANAVLRLVAEDGLAATTRMLNHAGGLTALSGGEADMRRLLADTGPRAGLAVDHFCHHALRHAGGLIALMGGVDALAFTGGIGEHAAPIRARLMAGLAFLGLTPDAAANAAHGPCLSAPGSDVTAWVVPADEARVIAGEARVLLAEGAQTDIPDLARNSKNRSQPPPRSR